jgi:hypothetical protein
MMPKLPQPLIEVAWKHTGEKGKIHYRARRPDGSNGPICAPAPPARRARDRGVSTDPAPANARSYGLSDSS